MQYFFGIWLDQPDPNYVYSTADLEGWMPPAEYTQACRGLEGATQKRIAKLFMQKPVSLLV